MPHRIKVAGPGYTNLLPRTEADYRALRKGIVVAVLVVAGLVSVSALRRHGQRVREINWDSIAGVIEDTRAVVVSKVDSQYGGAMLYQVQVLAKYAVGGQMQERWIAVSQRPENLAEAQFQGFRWKGAKCIVRWKPSDLSETVVEIE